MADVTQPLPWPIKRPYRHVPWIVRRVTRRLPWGLFCRCCGYWSDFDLFAGDCNRCKFGVCPDHRC